jgi:lipoprotein
MKKTVLVLGCLLAIGFSSVSCNRDDGLPESAVNIRSILPNRADHLIASMLGEPIYDAGSGYTTKNTPNPFGTEVYTGVTVSSVVKLDAADPANGAIYKVVLSNGIELGFKQDGDWAYVDGKGVLLKTSVWSYLPPAVDAAIRASSNSITTIAKIEVSAATPHVYTVTFQSGAVAKYNANGSVAP